ncbi:hypothetical protein FO519_000019 [Halicephalobus sp. NKZ332]|nr:hypothetical protein FO519_000019 [Halicephalobus sp. NKZ332]
MLGNSIWKESKEFEITRTYQASLPCCRDGIGQIACQALRRHQGSSFEKRCLNDNDFHTTLCCMECRNYIETHKIHPDNAKLIFKAPSMCKDKHSVAFCRKFKDYGMGKFSCKDAEFAMRTCRHSCGYCDDAIYDYAKTMPPCKSHCQLRAPIITFGITAENNFYCLSQANKDNVNYPRDSWPKAQKKYKLVGIPGYRFGILFEFSLDLKKIKIEIPFMNKQYGRSNVIILEFDFSFIRSFNFEDISYNKVLTIIYRTPPKIMCGRLCKDGTVIKCDRVIELPQGAPPNLINHIVNGSAIQLFLVEDISALTSMLSFSKIQRTETPMERFVFEPEWMDTGFFPPSYMLLTVTSLGYPGKYLLYRYRELMRHENVNELLHDMHFHIRKDPSLESIWVEPAPRLSLNDENYVNMRTVTITPHRIIFYPPAPTLSCYAFTRVDTSKLLEVRFRDDNMRQMSKQFIGAYRRIRDLCEKGLDVNRIIYNDALCSNSKFKEYGSYFYEGNKEEILNIWKSFGQFEKALPAKISSRIGLSYTAVRKGVTVRNCYWKQDIKSVDGKYNFTDGCGEISLECAKRLQKMLNIPYLPSAFQVRYPGFKGVLVVAAESLSQDAEIIFRESQKKFNPKIYPEVTLDVVQYSSPAPVKLHKLLIELLCQVAKNNGPRYKKRVEKRIKEYFDEFESAIIDQSVDPLSFKEALTNLPKYMDYNAMRSYEPTELVSEYFLRSLVQADSLEKSRLLYEKGQIPFPEEYARIMLGVADFSEQLKEGQVFIQYSERISPKCKDYKILTGKVAITKSPIYNSGDLRFVQAVDIPELRHLKDVVVFPVVGKRPISDQIGGGDMDGDQYAVIWDPKLMMPRSDEAADYSSPQSDEAKKITIDQVQDHIPIFREEYMLNEAVGGTANNHLILAEKYGFNNPTTKKYAKKLDYYLNYHKSGIPPGDKEKVICKFSPDHMRREHQPMYRLNNLLGKIYRKSKNLYDDILEIMELDDSKPFKDPLINVRGWSNYEEEARGAFQSFKQEVMMIMDRYGIKTEGELFSGKISEVSSHFNTHESEANHAASVFGLVQKLVSNLMEKYKSRYLNHFTPGWEQHRVCQEKEFFEFYSPYMPPEMKQFAVACYNVAYDDGSCIAFPWILWDVIDCVRHDSKNSGLCGYPFVAGVMEGANHRLYERPLARYSELSGYDIDFLKYVIGIFFHPQARAEIVIDSQFLKEIYSLAVHHSMIGNNHRIDYEEKLNFILKVIKELGVTQFDKYKEGVLSNVAKIFRATYLRIAFQKNPEIFRSGFYSDLKKLRLHRIIIEINTLIDKEVLEMRLLKESKCDNIAVRYLPWSRKTHQYSVLGYGSKDAIAALEDLLVLDMTNIVDTDPNRGHELKVQCLTRNLQDFMRQYRRGMGYGVNWR